MIENIPVKVQRNGTEPENQATYHTIIPCPDLYSVNFRSQNDVITNTTLSFDVSNFEGFI